MTRLLDALIGDEEIAIHFGDDAEIAAILRFEAALAEAEADSGLIAPAAARAVAEAVQTFVPDRERLAEGIAADGVVVPALVRQLRAAVGPAHAEAVHFGASSQDAVDTGLILRLAEVIPKQLARMRSIEEGLTALAEPGSAAGGRREAVADFATRAPGWAEPLGRLRANLDRIRGRLLVVQLGGPAGDRASFKGEGDIVARRLAALLDLGLASPWPSQRDPIVEFGGLMALISGALGKFGADIALMRRDRRNATASAEAEGGGTEPANPVAAETLVALARYNGGLAGLLQQAMLHDIERAGAALTLEWMVLPQLVVTTGRSLSLAERMLGRPVAPSE